MKTNFKTLTIGLLIATSLLTSCDGSRDKKTTDSVDSNKARQQGEDQVQTELQVKASQPANELADAAEQLVGPYTFMLAARVADLALDKDPTNLKALFYKKFLARAEAFRGIQVRVKPLLKPEQIANWERTQEQFPDSPIKSFLYDTSRPALNNAVDVQAVVSEYVKAVREFRIFLKANMNSEMIINLNPHVFEEKIRKEAIRDCQVVETGTDMNVICNSKAAAQVRLNSADFIALTQMTSGEMLYFGLLNSYSLEGIEGLAQFDPKNQKTTEERTNYLLKNSNFGKLRKDHIFSSLKEIGSDTSAALKWVTQYQTQLCPNGFNGSDDRRKGYLFSKGFCIGNATKTERALTMLDQALAGVIQIDAIDNTNQNTKLNVDLFAWSKAPIQDVRSITATGYASCGKPTGIKDNTLGGIFVDGNVNSYIISVRLNNSWVIC